MRDLFEIESASGRHPVRLTDAPVRDAVMSCEGSLILADSFFRDQLEGLDRPIIFIDASEEAKEFQALGPLIEQCRGQGLARSGRIVTLGGGVVQDIAGFVATVYMRGVKWTLLPTTLLAMVDSCIGGKSSINVGAFKNLVGSFYPPDEIIVPVAAVETLPPEHIAAGRCEAAKICFARGDECFDEYVALAAANGTAVDRMIELSLGAKKWFIEVDEFDQNERLLLNFGHSFGHALESCTSYGVTHGVAVGVGCLAAVAFSAEKHPGLDEHPRVQALSSDLLAILNELPELGERLEEVERGAFFRYWQSDKKHNPREYKPILLDERAQLERATLPRDAASDDAIWQAFEAAKGLVAA
ncbi:MAG: 3-dehydroquinate synthase [Sphingomonadales bacterium]|nr:3-dehydroquinate synthase [Sphingomonadales bacterium]